MVTWTSEIIVDPDNGPGLLQRRFIHGANKTELTIVATRAGITVTARTVVRDDRPRRGHGAVAILRARHWLDAWLEHRDRERLADLRPACDEAWRVVVGLRSDANYPLALPAEKR